MSWSLWAAFLVAAIVIAVSPGPGAVLSMATGLRHGYGGALRAIAGLQLALLIQLAVVALGLGAVLATSATAFLALKIAGAGYLVWLGVQKWRARPEPLDEAGAAQPARRSGLLLQGLLVNLTNPKAIIFMAALVPQFINPREPQFIQFVIIGLTMTAVDTLVMSCYAGLATRFRPLLRNPRALRLQNRVFGTLFVGAGAALAASSR